MRTLNQLLSALAVFGLLSLAGVASANEADARLEAFTQGLESLSARFEQRVFDANDQLVDESRGHLALSTAGRFRWEYEEPFPQEIVADGERIWIHDPDLEQVQIRRQDEPGQINPLAALMDPEERARQFILREDGERDGLDWIALEPRRSDEGFQAARLGFSASTLVQMELHDELGQRTVIEYSDWQRNPQLAPETFRFEPPAGVDVIGP